MIWLWENAATLAAIATVIAALVATFGLGVGLGQYWAACRFERRSIAHDKLNSLFEIAIQYPELANGRVNESLFYSKDENDIALFDRYAWIYSAVEMTMEFLWENYKGDEDWRDTIKYNMLLHREFVLSDYHREHGWWRTYNEDFVKFLANEVFHLPMEEVHRWRNIEVKDDDLDKPEKPAT